MPIKIITVVATLTLAFVPVGQTHAGNGPPEKSDNPGVPGLLAKISELEHELAETEDELSETEDELAETEDELSETEDALADAEDALAETEEELADLEDELNAEKKLFRVPQTGQDQCWDAPSNDPDDPHLTGPCASNGQDGEKQAGLAPPQNRFVDNNNGTITDTFTRLVWLKTGDCLTTDWESAVFIAGVISGNATVPICGIVDDSHLGDWRLPNVNEMMSLLDYGAMTFSGAGFPDGHPFTDVFTDFGEYYWTSTTFGLRADFDTSNFVYPCRRQGYDDNRFRFNDAYVVNVATGDLIRLPKELGTDISKRHKIGSGGSCTSSGFASGGPADGRAFPVPGLLVVRDATE